MGLVRFDGENYKGIIAIVIEGDEITLKGRKADRTLDLSLGRANSIRICNYKDKPVKVEKVYLNGGRNQVFFDGQVRECYSKRGNVYVTEDVMSVEKGKVVGYCEQAEKELEYVKNAKEKSSRKEAVLQISGIFDKISTKYILSTLRLTGNFGSVKTDSNIYVDGYIAEVSSCRELFCKRVTGYGGIKGVDFNEFADINGEL